LGVDGRERTRLRGRKTLCLALDERAARPVKRRTISVEDIPRVQTLVDECFYGKTGSFGRLHRPRNPSFTGGGACFRVLRCADASDVGGVSRTDTHVTGIRSRKRNRPSAKARCTWSSLTVAATASRPAALLRLVSGIDRSVDQQAATASRPAALLRPWGGGGLGGRRPDLGAKADAKAAAPTAAKSTSRGTVSYDLGKLADPGGAVNVGW
jgi:hypothetical protein